MQIYNTLLRKKSDFRSKENPINMYVCGPTVYDMPHIGHARAAYVFSIVRNYLKYSGFKVNYIRNITDIDDKIIEKAKVLLQKKKIDLTDESMAKEVRMVADKYLAEYQESLKLLEIQGPDKEPKATDYINEIIQFIGDLIDKGYAYEAEGSVYFKVSSFAEYGKLSRQDRDSMSPEAELGKKFVKESPLDFALWKKSKEHEPTWESPWSPGRPGWHIECSVMSKICGSETLDIHGGGLDLIFPHHENELAQSESLSKKPLANIWMHSGLLTIENQKMSKSLGNYISIEDFIKREGRRGSDYLKLIFLKSNYRSNVDYSETALSEAKAVWEKFYLAFYHFEKLEKSEGNLDNPNLREYIRKLTDLNNGFDKAMQDDFNTAKALSAIFDVVHVLNQAESDGKVDQSSNFALRRYARKHIFEKVATIFEIFTKNTLNAKKEESLNDQKVEELIEKREEARLQKNWELADQIRAELDCLNIQVEDSKSGTIWHRKIT